MDERRDHLADYVDQRITVTGLFDKFSLQVAGVRQWRTALLQDVYAEVEGKQIDIGHIWVQNAEAMKNLGLAYGDRLRCNCRVGVYKKRLNTPNKDGLMVVERYNLSWPTEIEVISRVTRASPDAPTDDQAGAAGPSQAGPVQAGGERASSPVS
jgi:hypothetical protein